MNARVDLAPVKDWRDFAKSYTAHPLAEVFPLLDEDSKDFIDLASSIGIHGVLDPIVLTRDMRVLDGRNRLRAALQALHPTDTEHAPRFVFFDELPIDHDALDEAGYVAAKNLHRRHLTDDQKAAAAAAIYHGHKAAANESRKKHLIPGAIHRGGQTSPTKKSTQRTREKVQEAAGVSERKARQALAVVEEAPELAKDVIAGKVTLREAAKRVKAGKTPPDRASRVRTDPPRQRPEISTGDVFVDDAAIKCWSVIKKEIGALAGADQRRACVETLTALMQQFSHQESDL